MYAARSNSLVKSHATGKPVGALHVHNGCLLASDE